MKFNKTLVAVAIAGIAAAPMIASADTTLSGVVQIQLKGDDSKAVEAVAAVKDDPATTADETVAAVEASNGDIRVSNGDARFQIVSEHELNNGLTGYGSLQYNLDRLSSAEGSVGADNVYVGVKGGFGDVRFGEIAVAAEYGQVANDIFDLTGAINGGIGYTGSFGPVSLGLSFAPENNEEVAGAGVKFALGGFAIGLGAETREEKMRASAGVSFAYAGASIAAHFWTKEDGFAGAEATGTAGTPGATAAIAASDQESVSVKVGYAFGGVSAGLTFSTQSSDTGGDDEAVRLDLAYGMGGGMELSTRITSFTGDNKELTEYRLQLGKSF